jgi:hypothetical protein
MLEKYTHLRSNPDEILPEIDLDLESVSSFKSFSIYWKCSQEPLLHCTNPCVRLPSPDAGCAR